MVSEMSRICNLVSDRTNFAPPSQNTEQLLQIDVKYVFDSYYILIHIYIYIYIYIYTYIHIHIYIYIFILHIYTFFYYFFIRITIVR